MRGWFSASPLSCFLSPLSSAGFSTETEIS